MSDLDNPSHSYWVGMWCIVLWVALTYHWTIIFLAIGIGLFGNCLLHLYNYTLNIIYAEQVVELHTKKKEDKKNENTPHGS